VTLAGGHGYPPCKKLMEMWVWLICQHFFVAGFPTFQTVNEMNFLYHGRIIFLCSYLNAITPIHTYMHLVAVTMNSKSPSCARFGGAPHHPNPPTGRKIYK
jgi:hypothetical protein